MVRRFGFGRQQREEVTAISPGPIVGRRQARLLQALPVIRRASVVRY